MTRSQESVRHVNGGRAKVSRVAEISGNNLKTLKNSSIWLKQIKPKSDIPLYYRINLTILHLINRLSDQDIFHFLILLCNLSGSQVWEILT